MRRFINDWVLMGFKPQHAAVVLGLLAAWAIIAACSEDLRSVLIKNSTTTPLEVSALGYHKKNLTVQWQSGVRVLRPDAETTVDVFPAEDMLVVVNMMAPQGQRTLVVSREALQNAGCRVVVTDEFLAALDPASPAFRDAQASILKDPLKLNPLVMSEPAYNSKHC
jgi:hypothetical protein